MAKTKEESKSNNVPATQEDLFAGMTPEQIAEILGITGQSMNYQMDRTPVLKINKFAIDDEQGNSVKMGHFVLGQIAKQDGDDVKIDFIGKDFGPNPEITIVKFGKQYSFMSKKKEDRCSSQIVLDPGEKAVGSNLGFYCEDNKCPRRGKDVDKDNKCSCQCIAFVEVGEEKEKALMYFKGTSYMPFMEYLDSAGKYPLFFFPTVLNTQRKVNGTNVYWIITPELQKDRPYPLEKRMELLETAKQVNSNVRDFEQQRKIRLAGNQEEERKQLPPGMSVEPAPAKTVNSGFASRAEDIDTDDIVF